MKIEIGVLDATPSKQIYRSIMVDYDINRAICELIDNGIDVWIRNGQNGDVTIKIDLDATQQAIVVEDNAGGLLQEELLYIVGPGQSGTKPSDKTIGIFGVGAKRAVVALAQEIKIKTRHGNEKTFEIDLNEAWLAENEWELPYYEIEEIGEGTTIVELHMLRMHVDATAITNLKEHLSATYARFIKNSHVIIELNGEKLLSRFFDNWAFPPDYGPRKLLSKINIEGQEVVLEICAGLTLESSPSTGEYGVYFYCNDRLVARALKTFEVGFVKGFAGQPHAKISLTRVIVSLSGAANSMPWNSSKSDISTHHPIFREIHDILNQIVKDYAALSRIWTGDWDDKVFQYNTGTIEEVHVDDLPTIRKSLIPPLPKSRPRYADIVSQRNKAIANQKPWTKGVYEGMIAAELTSKQKTLEYKNRISLILLDSTLEIAFKEYLVNDSGHYYSDAELKRIFNQRHLVQEEIKKYVHSIEDEEWQKVAYYNSIRNKLIHERADVEINSATIVGFRSLAESILNKLYNLKFD